VTISTKSAPMNTKHESIADIPLIIEFCKRLNIQHVIEKNIKTHGNQTGLTNSQLVLAWVAHILSENNHCKSPVEDWQKNHRLTLEGLLGTQIKDNDFEDCRLGRLLEKFAEDSVWHGIEKSFFQDSFSILELDTSAPVAFKQNESIENGIISTIKLDGTTAYGHHEIIDGGIMQKGWSKDHRSDLPQIKLMVSCEGNTGMQIASDVEAGNKNDDPLYIPIMQRTRAIVDTKGYLICGDCKMSSLENRTNFVENNEFFLAPLQLNKKLKKWMEDNLEEVFNEKKPLEIISYIDNDEVKIIGEGFEVAKIQKSIEGHLQWNERYLIIKSHEHADQEIKKFKNKIYKLQKELMKCESKLHATPEEAQQELLKKIKDSMESIPEFLLNVESIIELNESEYERSEKKRKGTYKIKKYRAKITNVVVNEEMLASISKKIGWRIYVTNAEKSILTLPSAYLFFRRTMYVIEIGFHNLKDYLNISPLYVRDQNQILGMTRLLMLALKILTLMTAELRSNMKKEKVQLVGLYPGQPSRKHSTPTAQSVLKYFVSQKLAIIGYKVGDMWNWEMTQITATCRSILKLLKLPENIFEKLTASVALRNESNP